MMAETKLDVIHVVWIKFLFCLSLTSLTTLGGAEEGLDLSEVLSKAHQSVSAFDGYTYNSVVERLGYADRHVSFKRHGDRYLMSSFYPDGKLERSFAFDGKTFYYFGSNDVLHVSSDLSKVYKFLTSFLVELPHTAPWFRMTRHGNYLADAFSGDQGSWSKAVAGGRILGLDKLSVPSHNPTSQGTSMEFAKSNFYPSEVIEESSESSYRLEVFESMDWGGIEVPAGVDIEIRDLPSGKLIQGISQKIRIDRDSIRRLSSEDIGVEQFRISTENATRLYDIDLGGMVILDE